MDSAILNALIGGLLIGVSATLMLMMLGRITGISGILAASLRPTPDSAWRYLFLVGLVAGAYSYHWLSGSPPAPASDAGWPVTIVAGLLVGAGTRIGGGCTSGHGVCGIARLSKRSIAATAAFMGAGMLTVFVMRNWVY